MPLPPTRLPRSVRSRALLGAVWPLVTAACSSTSPPAVHVPVPTASAAPARPPAIARPSGPIVLFTAMDGLLAPIVCHDGKAPLPSDSEECMALAPEGAKVALEGGGTATLGPPGEVPCRGSQINNFQGRKAESPDLDRAHYAVWPESAAGVVRRSEEDSKPTDKELAALSTLLQKESEGFFETPPKIEPTSGLTADIDGDGTPDRVFAAHNESHLMGLVAVFLGKAPDHPLALSVLAHDYPRLFGVTELDGRPGYELWITAALVEGIEDQTMTSAISERVVAFKDGKPEELGSWGCRMF